MILQTDGAGDLTTVEAIGRLIRITILITSGLIILQTLFRIFHVDQWLLVVWVVSLLALPQRFVIQFLGVY